MTDPNSKPRRRILTVNCNAGSQISLTSLLTQAGYAVDHAANGRVAARMHRLNPFDAAIVEIVMLEKNDLETLIQLTSHPSPPKLIAMSEKGRISAEVFLTMARHLGVQGALARPSQLGQLLDALHRVIDENIDAKPTCRAEVLRGGN